MAIALSTAETARPKMSELADTVDRSLIERIAEAEDVEAFERLYHDYRKRLGPFMYRIVADASANEEVFNDVMFTVWRKAATYNGTSKVSTWIFSIAYRQCLKCLRGRSSAVVAHELVAQGNDERPALERRDLVQKALARLSPEHRLVIELAYFQGNSYHEIAAIADCPENTVKTRMFYARRRLKEIMAALEGRPSPEEAT